VDARTDDLTPAASLAANGRTPPEPAQRMYLEHYGLREPPFSITPDPRFVYLSERHRDALAHLLFGIDKGGGGGFVQLTGEVGTGKTTLCRLLLEQLPDNARIALVLNPRQTPVELLESICEELHLPIDGKRGSSKALVDALNAYLLDAYAQGLRVVLIIDEAQDLSIESLEQVRLLTNLETDTQKLLQVILLGQPELRAVLAREDLRQLAQRITARFHLTPLDAAETERYLRHRYAIAGGRHLPFDAPAIRRLHARAGGVPRLLNVIAERSLLAGYARDTTRIDARLVDMAAREALPPVPHASAWPPVAWWLPAFALLALLVVATWPRSRDQPTQPASPLAARPTPAATPPPAHVTVAAAVPVLDAGAFVDRIDATDPSPLSAWQALLARWQLPTDVGDVAIAAACAPVLAPGVHCLRGNATLDALSAIGRPVLLSLHGRTHPASALLLGSDALHVRLWMGDGMFDVERLALLRAWHGDYAAIWRSTGPLPATLDPDDPIAHAWLDHRLPGKGAIGTRVRDFQRTHGLRADGVAGPETAFALAANDPGPRLRQALD